MWVRGLKLKIMYPMSKKTFESHPMWVRGLKLLLPKVPNIVQLSHPMWVRGLKLLMVSHP